MWNDELAEGEVRPRDKGVFFRGMIWSTGGNLVALAASLLTVMFAVRILDKSEMGAFFLLMVIAQFTITLGDFGLRNTSVKILSASAPEERTSVSQHLLTLRLLSSCVTCVVLTALIPVFLTLWSSEAFVRIAWFAVPMAFLMMIFQMGLALFIGHHRFRQFSTITAAMEVLRMIVSLILLQWGFGTLGLVYGFLFSRVLGLVVLWRSLPFDLRLRISHPERWNILKFGGWLHAGSVMSVVNAKVVDGLLTTFMGTAVLAAYTTALQVPNITLKFFESVRPAVLSYVAALKLAAQRAAVVGVRLLSALLSLAVGFVITFATPLVQLLYSSKYLSSVPIMQALSVWVVFGIVNYFLSLTLIGLGRPKAVFLVTLPQFATMLFSTVMLVPKLSGLGAALALLVTAIVGNAITTWLLADHDLKLYRSLNAAFLRSALPLLVLFLLDVLTNPPLLLSIGYLAVMIGLLLLLGSITPHDLRMLYAQATQKPRTAAVEAPG